MKPFTEVPWKSPAVFTRANKIDWIWRVSDFYRQIQVRYWLLWSWVCPPALHLSRAWTRPTLFQFSSDINLNKIVFPIKEKTQTIKVTFKILKESIMIIDCIWDSVGYRVRRHAQRDIWMSIWMSALSMSALSMSLSVLSCQRRDRVKSRNLFNAFNILWWHFYAKNGSVWT